MKAGTASNVNATVTFTFNPRTFTVCNDEASGGTALWIDFTDGVAVASDDSTNIRILAAECHSWTFDSNNVLDSFTVGVITAAATAAYRMEGAR